MGRAFSCLLYPKDGGQPRLVVVLNERADGWLVASVPADSFDAPQSSTFLSSSEWSRKEETK